jgi:hypothetical protein
MKKHWRVIVAFSLTGLLVTCAYVTYLYTTYPNRIPKVDMLFNLLCTPSIVTLI